MFVQNKILFIVIVVQSNTLDWLKPKCNVTTDTKRRTFLCEEVICVKCLFVNLFVNISSYCDRSTIILLFFQREISSWGMMVQRAS